MSKFILTVEDGEIRGQPAVKIDVKFEPAPSKADPTLAHIFGGVLVRFAKDGRAYEETNELRACYQYLAEAGFDKDQLAELLDKPQGAAVRAIKAAMANG